MLRTEAASNNVNDYGVNKSVENLPVLRNALATINRSWLGSHGFGHGRNSTILRHPTVTDRSG